MHQCANRGDTPSAMNTPEVSSGSQSFYTMVIAVPVCKPVNIASCHKFIKIFQISRVVNSGTCRVGELHRLAVSQENHDFRVCVLSVLVPPCNLSCCGAKVKKRVSSFTISCINA